MADVKNALSSAAYKKYKLTPHNKSINVDRFYTPRHFAQVKLKIMAWSMIEILAWTEVFARYTPV